MNSEMDILNLKYNGALLDRKYSNDVIQEQQTQRTAIVKGIIGAGFTAGKGAGEGGIV